VFSLQSCRALRLQRQQLKVLWRAREERLRGRTRARASGGGVMDQLDVLLGQFLVPDNASRKHAEEQIRRLSKDPLLVPALLHHVRSSPYPEVRQLAAVLLRKKITGHWMQLSVEVRNNVKSTLLESITLENR
jgi:hypothetical protein